MYKIYSYKKKKKLVIFNIKPTANTFGKFITGRVKIISATLNKRKRQNIDLKWLCSHYYFVHVSLSYKTYSLHYLFLEIVVNLFHQSCRYIKFQLPMRISTDLNTSVVLSHLYLLGLTIGTYL